jgi:hypothetical protein
LPRSGRLVQMAVGAASCMVAHLYRRSAVAARVVFVTNGSNEGSARVRPSHPPASAFILGTIEVAIIAAAIVILFVFPSSTLVLVLGSIGAAAGLLGLISLIWGNKKRITVIYDSVVLANRIMSSVIARDSNLRFEDLIGLRRYERALRRVGAYEEAFEIGDFIEERINRDASGPGETGLTFSTS